jgi:lipoprotein-anchoring transpeptidase ErfK/SrfK
LSKSRRGKPGAGPNEESSFWWFLIVLFIAGVGTWIWWSSKQSAKSKKSPVATKLLPLPGKPSLTNTTLPPKTNFVPKLSLVLTSAPVTELVKTSTPNLKPMLRGDYPRPPRDTLEAQVSLSQFAISSGSIDGSIGSQTRAALAAFQKHIGVPATGELDSATRAELFLAAAPLTNYVISSNDLARLQPVSKTWLQKSQQTALDYENILELLGERGHASPNLIRRLNPNLNWSNLVAGAEVTIPNASYPKPSTKAALIVISLSKKQLEAFDDETNLLAHFPCSIAARFDKRPVGELHVKTVAVNPDYTFNPEVFPESEEARKLPGKLIIPPGPNNPVGIAWVGLDKPGYGMHGTPNPEQVGRTESHGCFRLANWNAEYLAKIVWIGLPVRVEP